MVSLPESGNEVIPEVDIPQSPVNSEIPQLGGGRRGPFDRFPLTEVLPSALTGAVAGTATVALHTPLWATLGIGFGIAVVGVIRINERNIWRTLKMRAALRLRSRRDGDNAGSAEPFDVPVPDAAGERCGMRWDGRHLLTMLRVERANVAPTLLRPREIRTGDAVSLAEVARCLSQFDIRLAAIDVVTLGVRTRGEHEVVRLYERLLGPLPASTSRTVCLVLRFDPVANVEAIQNRGGGHEGTLRTALVATRRVASRLATRGVRVRMLTAAELAAAEAEMLHGAAPGDWTERWHAVRHGEIELTGYAVRPHRLNSEVLAGIWSLPGMSTLLRLRLTPVPGSRTPEGDGGEVSVSALVRHDTRAGGLGADRKVVRELGLRPLAGLQRRVLLESGSLAPVGAASGPPAALAGLAVPAGDCGQVIGATEDGFGVAVPLFGPTVRTVEIVGSLHLVQQMILRAVAVGGRAIVHTGRAQAWMQLAAMVDRPEVLSVTRPGGGAHHTAAATIIVYDGIGSAGQVSEATVVYVREPDEVSADAPEADVVLVESPEQPGRVHIRTAGGELAVQVVSIPEERRYLVDAAGYRREVLQPS
ncbi:type VII secretion protein EccE [Nocardia albiluteola]|nr:type VII secretion protein EccE [Nocardia albiluteola]